MTKKTLWKETYREIFSKVLRFLALVGIIALGTGFFVGIRATAPDMRQTSTNYYNQQQLEDLSLTATYGLADEDERILADIPGISYQKEHYVDVENEEDNGVMRLYPMTSEDSFNQFQLVDGRWPEANDEIAVDAEAPELSEDYAIGQTVTYETAKDLLPDNHTDNINDLKGRTYKIVGTVRSPKFINRATSRGYTPVGKGTIDAFGVISPEEIEGDATNAFAIRLNTERSNIYDEDYQATVDAKQDEIEQAFEERQDDVTEEVKTQAQSDLEEQKRKIDEAKSTISTQQTALANAWEELRTAQAEYQARLNQAWQAFPSGEAPLQVALPLQQAAEQLQQTENTLSQRQAQFDAQVGESNQELADAEAQIEAGEAQIEQLPEANYQTTATASSGDVSEYGENADRIAAIARVFPWLFFLVAAMVTFTTMTRMVDEQRTQMGTMKAFGYDTKDIVLKYVTYAGVACVLGSTVGILIGNYLFPTIIYGAYQLLYDLPPVDYQWGWFDIVLTVAIAVLTSVAPAGATAWRSLNVQAAELMRPKPPKQGEHIFVERWHWLWRRLSFMSKITLRNLFRYKGRNTMTVVGIVGCTALILTGFAISDSVVDIPDEQFDVIEKYDAGISLADQLDDEDISEITSEIKDERSDAQVLPLYVDTYRTAEEDEKPHDINLNILDTDSDYRGFYLLESKADQERLALPEEGALITEKIARLLSIDVGDTITLESDQGEEVSFPVKGIVKNYIFHNVFVSEGAFAEATGEQVAPNRLNVQMTTGDEAEQDQFSETLMADDDRVRTVFFTQTIKDSFTGTLDTLSDVTVVLIVAAALLAFIVLYNLQSVNVSERMQELSTIKVLGMYPEEVTGYLYRETFLLTLIGIVLGLFGGYFLTDYIMTTVEIDQMVFPTRINWQSYLYSIGLTLLFSVVVMLIIHRRLKKIDMVEALKGTE